MNTSADRFYLAFLFVSYKFFPLTVPPAVILNFIEREGLLHMSDFQFSTYIDLAIQNERIQRISKLN
jgi:hypothetical protein